MKDVTNSSRPFKSSSNKGRFIAYLILLLSVSSTVKLRLLCLLGIFGLAFHRKLSY